jgi:hypothetical protein
MERPATVFVTYLLENSDLFLEESSFGYNTPIHCNYIQKITTDDINDKSISLSFGDDEEFRFMANPSDITTSSSGYGWNADKFYILAQIVDGIGDNIKPLPDQWRKIDKTSYINNFSVWVGKTIPPDDLKISVFIIRNDEYDNAPLYDLTYLNYPTILDENNLQFGEEVFFYGNVKARISANIYSMTINAILPLSEFNVSQNPTWEPGDTVYITEIGIYDDDGTLLGIGKLNSPIDKDPNKYRTIEFKIDF